MPKVIPWILVNKFKNISEFNLVIETLPPFTTTNNNQVNCVVCNGGKIHKMRQKYMVCSSKLCGKDCTAKYKLSIV